MIRKTPPSPSLPRKVASLSEEEGKGKPRKGISTYIGRRADLYWSTHRPILVTRRTYIGQPADQYRFTPPIHRDPATKLYQHSAYAYSKARYTELYSLPKKRRKPSASPLARELALGGIWVERSYSPLPVEVVDADLTARTYAVGRTRRANT